MDPRPVPRSSRFLIAYAAANAGGAVSYVPLLTMLVPLKVEAIAPDARIGLLATIAVAGAVAASIANIVFGWASDRSVARGGSRRAWIGAGLIAIAASYAGIALAHRAMAIIVAVVLFQLAANLMLAPLTATMADEVPDRQKGVMGGMLAAATPVAALITSLLVASPLGEPARLGAVVAVLLLLIAPLLLTRRRPLPTVAPSPGTRAVARRDLALAWLARLFFQIAGCVLFLYLLYYFETKAPGVSGIRLAPLVALLTAVTAALPVPLAVLVGWASDRQRIRKPFLLGAASVAATGLVTMAAAPGWWSAVAGFALYAAGSAVFLGLQQAFAMELLPSPLHRGRDLALLNLTNTLPSMLGPPLTWAIATRENFTPMLLVLAAMALAGGLALVPVRSGR